MSNEKMREEFEVWAKTRLLGVTRDGVVTAYASPLTDFLWDSWQASRAALAAEIEPLRIGNTDLRNDNKSLRGSCEAIGKLYKSVKRDRNAFRRECVRLEAEVEALRKDAERYRYMRKCSCDFRSSLPNHESVSEAEYDAECDAGLSKEFAK